MYDQIEKISFKGSQSKDPFSFRFYDKNKVVGEKTMGEQLRFAMSWWHTVNASGTDMFGGDTMDKTFGLSGMDMYKAKADFAFGFMKKLGIDYYCFHDVDVAPEGETLGESVKNLEIMTDYLLQKQKETGIKPLWVTANMFGDKKFMAGAATSPDADVFAIAAGKVKAGIDAAVKLGAKGYVFWGGREGYDTLLNTDMALELENLGRFMRMARDYGRSHGFDGDFYIEPKPKEPTKHQYDFDAATCANFLRANGLEKDFKLNIEANHATLAGHTFQHELRVAAVNGMFGSIDANQGDMLLGWDTDQFPTNVYDTTLAMYEVIKAGGFTNGGLNFDAKARRQSNTLEDTVLSYIAGMDAFALGLIKARRIIDDGRIDCFIKQRYASYRDGIGLRMTQGKETLESLAAYAADLKGVTPGSGRQEYLEAVMNDILFSGETK